MNLLKSFLLLSAGLILNFSIQAQKPDLNSKIPVDPDLKMGKLKNGISYYIKKNTKPLNRAEMRLVVTQVQ